MSILLGFFLATASLTAAAAGGLEYPLESIQPDYNDKASLQRGFGTYSHYCMGCHSLKYQRYERTAEDLSIDPEMLIEEIVPFDKKIGDLGTISMPEDAAADWFGAPPPDLTLVARKRSPEWIYTYLKSFYTDLSRPLGINNKVFPKVGMPHVLEPLQGIQRIVCKEPGAGQQSIEDQCGTLERVKGTGALNAVEYDQLIYDLVNFLEYVGEPSKAKSHDIGIFVLMFLMLFFIFAYLLKREYWKDVH